VSDGIVWLADFPDDRTKAFLDTPFRIGDVEFMSTLRQRRAFPQLCVMKPPYLVERTAALVQQFRHANILELGIRFGGSAAMISQLADPRKHVAIELEPTPVQKLEDFIDRTGRRETLRPYYGVDQADRERLREILDREFGEETLDLVIDDASHLLDETRASFEVVFPRLRPGGLFILEDWNWQHLQQSALQDALNREEPEVRADFNARFKEAMADPSSDVYASFVEWMQRLEEDPTSRPQYTGEKRPLEVLVMELVLARAGVGEAITRVTVEDLWVIVERGPAELDPVEFRMSDIVRDPFGILPPTNGPRSAPGEA
jgi:predicted O-methyltransferase YrrM